MCISHTFANYVLYVQKIFPLKITRVNYDTSKIHDRNEPRSYRTNSAEKSQANCTVFILFFTVATKLYEFEKDSLQTENRNTDVREPADGLERDKIRRDVIALDEDLGMAEKLNDKEVQVYTKQCDILGVRFDIQDKNEKIVRLDLKRLESETESDESAKLKKI